jgi:DNA-binding transcriptional MocR family regulator
MEKNFLYMGVAEELAARIRGGEFAVGDRLPSLRELRRRTGFGLATVYQAYLELERRGLVVSRPRSGFVVEGGRPSLPLPETFRGVPDPLHPTRSALAAAVVEAAATPSILPLGGASPSPELMPRAFLARLTREVLRQEMDSVVGYEHPKGYPELRRRIARRCLGRAGFLSPEEIVITNGATEAVSLCLRAVTQPGDAVLVESPAYHGFLQIMEDLGLFALEVPARPDRGLDPAQVEAVLAQRKVAACLVVPNVNNPQGFIMKNEDKEALVEILTRRDIPVIEDDTYGELAYGEERPRMLRAFDRRGLVLSCSTFSKTLAAGMRLGWAAAGRFSEKVARFKLNASVGTGSLHQRVVASVLEKEPTFERHLRHLRNTFRRSIDLARRGVERHFPEGTRLSAPQGGALLWVELPPGGDSLELYRRALESRIAILPGLICSTTDAYRRYIRLNCGHSWNEEFDEGVRVLGGIAHTFAKA